MSLLDKAKEFGKQNKQVRVYNSAEVVKKAMMGEFTVEQMYEYDGLFPSWEMGTFAVGDIRNHKGILYKCIQAHTSTGDPNATSVAMHTPDITPSLWVVIQPEPVNGDILEWVAGEAVNAGDLRIYNGVTYECISGHTTQAGWTPPVVPALWKAVT